MMTNDTPPLDDGQAFALWLNPPVPSTIAERAGLSEPAPLVRLAAARRRATLHALRYRADAARYARLADSLLLSCGSAEAEVDVLHGALRGLRDDCATLEYERQALASAVAAYARAMTYADAIQRTGFPADEVRAAWEAAQSAYDAMCELAGVEDA